MNPSSASRILLAQILTEDFIENKKEIVTNQVYLEKQLIQLEALRLMYKQNSQDQRVSSRARARARDLEQNAAGLINGIKFGISLLICEQKKEKLE